MFRKSKMITFGNWHGVNNVQDASLISDKELQECVNFYVSNTGRLISRPGIEKAFDAPANVKCITQYNGNFYIACSDGNIYKWDGNSLTNIGTFDADHDIYMVVAFGYLFVADGGTLRYYDGVSWSNAGNFGTATEHIGDNISSFDYTVANTPVSPTSGSCDSCNRVTYVDGSVTANAFDDGYGHFNHDTSYQGEATLTSTMNYQTGRITGQFSSTVDSVDIYYNYGQYIQADFIEFRQERLWAAKGDTLWYSGIRDPSSWDFIKIASKDESEISGLDRIYDKLVIFKEGKDRGIYVLSGNSDSDFAVTLISKGVSTTQKSKTHILGDLFFLDGGQLYSLKTIVEYGEIKPIPINQRFAINGSGYLFIPIPVENVIFAANNNLGFSYNAVKTAFTSLNFGLPIYSYLVVNNDVYIGSSDGVYKFSNVNTDNNQEISFIIKTKALNIAGFRRVLLKGLSFAVGGIDDVDLDISIFREETGFSLLNTTVNQSTSSWDSSTWDTDKWATTSKYFHRIRQVFSGEYIYLQFFAKQRFILDTITMEVA